MPVTPGRESFSCRSSDTSPPAVSASGSEVSSPARIDGTPINSVEGELPHMNIDLELPGAIEPTEPDGTPIFQVGADIEFATMENDWLTGKILQGPNLKDSY